MDLERGAAHSPPEMAARDPRPTCEERGKELTEGDMATTRTETSSTCSSRAFKRAREPEVILDVKLRG